MKTNTTNFDLMRLFDKMDKELLTILEIAKGTNTKSNLTVHLLVLLARQHDFNALVIKELTKKYDR